MSRHQIVRALGWSVLVCAVVALMAAILMEGFQGPWQPNTLLQVTGLFTLAFAVVATVVCLPSFAALQRFTRLLGSRKVAAFVGAVLAPLATVVVVVAVFRGQGDPRTVMDWLRFYAENLASFGLGISPFILAGATFGFVWAAPEPAPKPVVVKRRR